MKIASIASLCFLLLISCSKNEKQGGGTSGDENTMVLKEDDEVSETTKERTNWDDVDITSPIVRYDEVKSKDVEVRGSEKMSVYSVDETVLFETDKASIHTKGKNALKDVITSVKQRHPDGEVAVMGYTDSQGSAAHNKDLSKERAEAVAEYLRENSGLKKDDITVIAKGERNPAASNATEEGRRQNRRVEIVVRNR